MAPWTTIYLYTQVVFDFDYFRVYTELLWARLKLWDTKAHDTKATGNPCLLTSQHGRPNLLHIHSMVQSKSDCVDSAERCWPQQSKQKRVTCLAALQAECCPCVWQEYVPKPHLGSCWPADVRAQTTTIIYIAIAFLVLPLLQCRTKQYESSEALNFSVLLPLTSSWNQSSTVPSPGADSHRVGVNAW